MTGPLFSKNKLSPGLEIKNVKSHVGLLLLKSLKKAYISKQVFVDWMKVRTKNDVGEREKAGAAHDGKPTSAQNL